MQAHPYIIHWQIKIGYSIIRGGVGTVSAIVIEHPILSAQAVISTIKRKGYAL